MSDYVIFTDSSCDLPAALADEFELTVVPLVVHMEGREYHNYLDEREITFKDFYQKMRDGVMATTSAGNIGDFTERMIPVLESGKDIIYLAFSEALSSIYNNGVAAVEELKPLYPERKMICINTRCASLGEGLIVDLAVRKKRAGATIEELRDYVYETIPHLCHWFTVDDLNHLKRGGRVSPATAIVGTVLGIKPVMHTDDDGCLTKTGIARGRRASINAMFEKLRDTAIDIRSQTVYISHGDCMEDVEYLISLIKPLGPVDIRVNHVGPVIGAHTGAGVMALFFLGTER